MTPARATLGTLVQCRPMWFWHVCGAVVTVAILFSASSRLGATFSIMLIPLWTGVISASMYKDFLTKPFSFCTPRHAVVWRRTLFAIAFVVAGLCGVISLLIPAASPGAAAVTAWQTFTLGVALFMAAALLSLVTANVSFLPTLMTGLLIISFNDDIGEVVRVSIEGALLASPLLTTVACVAIASAAWRHLGSRGRAREMSGAAFLGLHSSFNGERTAAYNAERKMQLMRRSPGRIMQVLERFFIARMRSLPGHATLRSLWGGLYVQTGKSAPATASNFIALSLLIIALSLLLGYYHPRRLEPGTSSANLILFLLVSINAEYRINPFAGLLLTVSRKNRFWSLMFSGVAQWLVVAVFAALLTAMSIAAGAFLDEFTVRGATYTYTPVHPKAFLVFAPLMPFYFLSQVAFPRRHVIALMVIASVGIIVFFGGGHELLHASWPGLLLLQAASWLPFVAFICHYCYSRDLSLNGH